MWLLIDNQVGSQEGFPNESAGGWRGDSLLIGDHWTGDLRTSFPPIKVKRVFAHLFSIFPI